MKPIRKIINSTTSRSGSKPKGQGISVSLTSSNSVSGASGAACFISYSGWRAVFKSLSGKASFSSSNDRLRMQMIEEGAKLKTWTGLKI